MDTEKRQDMIRLSQEQKRLAEEPPLMPGQPRPPAPAPRQHEVTPPLYLPLTLNACLVVLLLTLALFDDMM